MPKHSFAFRKFAPRTAPVRHCKVIGDLFYRDEPFCGEAYLACVTERGL